MTEMRVEALADMDPSDALIIVAFPGLGAAAPIAAQYLIERLDMPLVGHITSDAFNGVVHIEQGVASSPIRILGGDVACQLDKPCQRVYVVTTEVPASMPVFVEAGRTIMAWARHARLVLSLEAVVRAEGDHSPDVFYACSSPLGVQRIANAKLEPLARATIAGGAASILAGRRESAPTAAFIVEATADHPDGRAAVALVEALNPLIPQIDIDAAPLLEDAMRLESMIKRAMSEAETVQQPRSLGSFV